jgi:hypothetical protein
MTVAAARRRSDSDKHRVGLAYRPCKVGIKIEPTILNVVLYKPLEIRFENRDFTTSERCDL